MDFSKFTGEVKNLYLKIHSLMRILILIMLLCFRFKILKSLMDVSKIRDFNWCKFTISGLVDGVWRWQENETSHFQGPLTFLLVGDIFISTVLMIITYFFTLTC